MNTSEVNVEFGDGFINWLSENSCNLVISAYKKNTIFSIGTVTIDSKKHSLLWMHFFRRPTGLCYSHKSLIIGTIKELFHYRDIGPVSFKNCSVNKFTNVFMPFKIDITTDIDIHDITVDRSNQIYFVSALFNSICKPSTSCGDFFDIHWKPPWISQIVPEDRCHLNGLCTRDGILRYVTSVSQADIINGWRDKRLNGGIIYDLVENRVIMSGLSMPHSPRWYQDKLWILEAGSGYFGYIENTQFIQKTFIPGFIRGLTFVNDRFAIICSSQDRHDNSFNNLQLHQLLTSKNTTSKCGVFIVDLTTFEIVNYMIFNKGPIELYDVVAIPQSESTRLIELDDSFIQTFNKQGIVNSKQL